MVGRLHAPVRPALEGVKAQTTDCETGCSRTIPGTISALCGPYYRSPTSSTEAVNPGDAPEHHRELPQCAWRQAGEEAWPRHLKDMIGAKADKPHAANNLLKVLRVLLGYAVEST